VARTVIDKSIDASSIFSTTKEWTDNIERHVTIYGNTMHKSENYFDDV